MLMCKKERFVKTVHAAGPERELIMIDSENIKTTKSIEKSSPQIKNKNSQLSVPKKPIVTGAQGNSSRLSADRAGKASRETHAQARYYPPPRNRQCHGILTAPTADENYRGCR
ncbi:unnamed protein product [Parnassius apollo]|uniref:(apollo) hypothetical protein n=1 Tax=Parnassius apollo TaxID=110799 RepID=A0A8S3XIL6_PARAO|nr:unnamed protein product [Parnassius apollo]